MSNEQIDQMKKHLHVCACLWILIQYSFSQNTLVLKGVIYDTSSSPIEHVHIYNETAKVGTTSNKKGEFKISVSEGDWLKISNIQYISKKIRIKKGNLRTGFLQVHVIARNNLLKEVELTKPLKGTLTSDILKPKKDSISAQMELLIGSIMDIPFEEIMNMDIGADEQHLKKPDNAQLLTDPISKTAGLPLVKIALPDPYVEKKRALREKINFKERFPNRLLQLLGEDFFFIKLKIPKEKYHHFLSYCDSLGIETLFKEEKHLELLKILLKESKSYLIVIENNK